mgnify:CR=1 FL=1
MIVQMLSYPNVQRNSSTILRNFAKTRAYSPPLYGSRVYTFLFIRKERGNKLFDAEVTLGLLRHLLSLKDEVTQATVAWTLYSLIDPTIITSPGNTPPSL